MKYLNAMIPWPKYRVEDLVIHQLLVCMLQ